MSVWVVRSIERFADTVLTSTFWLLAFGRIVIADVRWYHQLWKYIDVDKEKTLIIAVRWKSEEIAIESDKIPLPVRPANKEKLTELIQLESALSTLFTMG